MADRLAIASDLLISFLSIVLIPILLIFSVISITSNPFDLISIISSASFKFFCTFVFLILFEIFKIDFISGSLKSFPFVSISLVKLSGIIFEIPLIVFSAIFKDETAVSMSFSFTCFSTKSKTLFSSFKDLSIFIASTVLLWSKLDISFLISPISEAKLSKVSAYELILKVVNKKIMIIFKKSFIINLFFP